MKLLLLITFLSIVHCDLPVHCLKHQIAGQWKFLVQRSELKGMGPLGCGHQIPDSAKTSFKADEDSFFEDSTFEVVLSIDYTVKDATPDSQQVKGSWTMVYDEGFEVNIQSRSYFAFSKYKFKSDTEADSYCDKTLVGWYNDHNTGERGCYRAERSEKLEATTSLHSESVLQPNSFLQQWDREKHQSVVDKINSNESYKWEAHLYDHLIGKSFAQIFGRKNKYVQPPKKEEQKKKSSSFLELNDQLPLSYDWKEYVTEPKQQKQCGACYAISAMEMLSSRLRIQGYRNVELSTQQTLNCNYYNQGCDGGYAYLVFRYGEENYLVTEEAEPFKAVDGKCKSQKYADQERVYQVSNYHYIGGGYGLANEQDIMAEIKANGPVVMNFNPDFTFMYYKSGVYHLKYEDQDIEDADWQVVTHSVLCYGWGEENGEKYWLLQNSWGKEWGIDGSFKLKRGVDEANCESMAEAADPIVVNRDKTLTNNQKKW